jgi:Tol biopolymer transport system component
MHPIRGVALGVLGIVACSDGTAPLPRNVVVTVQPPFAGAFASLGDVHTLSVTVTDTLGSPLSDAITWDVIPSTSAVTVSTAGVVTIAPSATARDYLVRATASRISDTTIVRVLPRPAGKLVFAASSPGVSQIYVKDFAADGDAILVNSAAGSTAGLAVAQSSGTIFFSRGTLPNVDLFRMNLNGSSMTNLTNDPAASNQGPAIHPITGDVYFTRRPTPAAPAQVFRMRPDGTDLTQVSAGTQSKLIPAISPDGTRLSWSETFTPGINIELVTAGISGTDPERLTNRTGTDAAAVWISNSRIVWGTSFGGQLDVVSADVPGGGNLTNLTNGAGSSSQPSLGCTPGTVTFVRARSTESAVFQLDIATQLATKYVLPVNRSVAFARRIC